MTREEASFIIQNSDVIVDEDYSEAVKVAAEALKELIENPIRNGEWVLMTDVSKYYMPGRVHARMACSKCEHTGAIAIFSIEEWDEYQKDHWKPALKPYCSTCGAKMINPRS